jgi:hypothetical protein
MTENVCLGLVFAKTGSINSGTGFGIRIHIVDQQLPCEFCDPIHTILKLINKSSVADPDFFNPDPAFEVNPDPGF